MSEVNPKVSIILPTYNGAKYLRQAIDSCLSQTYRNIELIIVDDFSTDQTPEIIKSYEDPRIKYIRNEKNQRLPRSLNIGFAASSGDYLTWTSDDNFYLPQAIEKMLKYLEENKGEYVYADIFAFREDNFQGAEPVYLRDCEEMNRCNCVRACFLYTRKVMEVVGEYDPDMELIEDYDYWVRIWQHFYLYHIKEPLYYYRYHSEALWSINIRESPIREFLFKLKYDFMSIDVINWNLRSLRRGTLNGLARFGQALIDRVFYREKINRILKNYKERKSTFTHTRKILDKFINGTKGESS